MTDYYGSSLFRRGIEHTTIHSKDNHYPNLPLMWSMQGWKEKVRKLIYLYDLLTYLDIDVLELRDGFWLRFILQILVTIRSMDIVVIDMPNKEHQKINIKLEEAFQKW